MQVKIVSVEAKNNLKLLLSYSTGERKEFDVAPYATGGWFGELKDPRVLLERSVCFPTDRESSGLTTRTLPPPRAV